MNIKWSWHYLWYYLLFGVVYQLLFYHTLNPFYFSTWWHVAAWVGYMVIAIIVYFFWWTFTLLIIFGLMLWLLAMVNEKIRAFIISIWNDVKKMMGRS